MNEVIQNILERRSVRVYSDEQIKDGHLEIILKAGYYAPSACNSQPWHFTVIQNAEIIQSLNLATKNELLNSDNELFRKMGANESYNIFYKAPTIIVVSGEKGSVMPQTDCAAATQNMILAAESLGIGSCWIGLVAYLFKSNRADEFLKLIQIPENYELYYAVTLGYKKYPNPKPQSRRENTINYIK